jgi:hypothetical protein
LKTIGSKAFQFSPRLNKITNLPKNIDRNSLNLSSNVVFNESSEPITSPVPASIPASIPAPQVFDKCNKGYFGFGKYLSVDDDKKCKPPDDDEIKRLCNGQNSKCPHQNGSNSIFYLNRELSLRSGNKRCDPSNNCLPPTVK